MFAGGRRYQSDDKLFNWRLLENRCISAVVNSIFELH